MIADEVVETAEANLPQVVIARVSQHAIMIDAAIHLDRERKITGR